MPQAVSRSGSPRDANGAMTDPPTAKAAARSSETKGFVRGHLGSTSTQRAQLPAATHAKVQCFAVSSTDMKLIVVTLPPGRLRPFPDRVAPGGSGVRN